MPRKPRIEYEGAVYHVISRGDREQNIVHSDKDRRVFVETLDEACLRTGWFVHAWVLMDNHYHILLETPEPNLVAGMKWFQGTYTTRFNCRNQTKGHLYQGRYKAIPVDTADPEYFRIVSTYIHLNPARAGMLDENNPCLEDYAWGSYPAYLNPKLRPEWIKVEQVLGSLDLEDKKSGRRKYSEYIDRRIKETIESANPATAFTEWEDLRKSWYIGSSLFRSELLKEIDKKSEEIKEDSWSGPAIALHNEKRAEKLIVAGLEILGIKESSLDDMRKSAPEKVIIAWLVRAKTHVLNKWIAQRLKMGRATNLARMINQVELNDSKYSDLKTKMMKI